VSLSPASEFLAIPPGFADITPHLPYTSAVLPLHPPPSNPVYDNMPGLGLWELAVIGLLAVLLFGKNLPEVAKRLGKQYFEFRKGLTSIQADFHQATDGAFSPETYASESAASQFYRDDDLDDLEEATAPKFEPPPDDESTRT